jgi:hypothetical protein
MKMAPGKAGWPHTLADVTQPKVPATSAETLDKWNRTRAVLAHFVIHLGISVLREGRKSANIRSSSGAIRGIPA